MVGKYSWVDVFIALQRLNSSIGRGGLNINILIQNHLDQTAEMRQCAVRRNNNINCRLYFFLIDNFFDTLNKRWQKILLEIFHNIFFRFTTNTHGRIEEIMVWIICIICSSYIGLKFNAKQGRTDSFCPSLWNFLCSLSLLCIH